MTIPEWMLEAYYLKSGDTGTSGDACICNEHGFLTYSIDGNYFVMHNVFGNGEYWQKLMEQMAKDLGCTIIRCGTWRNPLPMCRKYGYKVTRTGSILEKEI